MGVLGRVGGPRCAGVWMLGLAATTALAGVSALTGPAAAQGVAVPPVEVRTARPKPAPRPRPIAQPRRPAPPVQARVAPAPRPRVARAAPRIAARRVTPPLSSAPPAEVGAPNAGLGAGTGPGVERPDGPVRGFVATVSETGTKTNTPRIETPQAISVVGREQIDTLKAQTLLEATRYTPGIVSETFGTDTRNDFFLIRGFQAEQNGIFLNGLQLPSVSFATFKLEPFGLERIEVLRGPSSVLYGGTNPGGLINAVSKRPSEVPLNYVELGVSSFGNAYGAFDFGGPAAVNENGQFFTRLTGLIRGGGTQTDFTGDDRVFIAPSLTWRPSGDTSFTFLGSYQRDSTNGQNFLPYVGTVVPAPFGRIPTRLFTSEPGLDRFQREQALVGYEFQHRFDDVFSFRQNFRYSYVDVDFRTLFGAGFFPDPTATQASLTRFNFITTPRANVVNVDNQLEARFLTGPLSHTVLLGLDYKRYRIDDNQGFEFGTSLDLVRPVYTGAVSPGSRFILANTVQDQLGVYLQDQVKFDRFTLVLSGRQDFVATDRADKLFPTGSFQSSDSAFSGRAGLIYTSEIGLAPYISYSRSFLPLIGTLGGTTTPLQPEFGEQVEAGIKYQPEGSRSFIGLAVFDLTRQNVVTADPTLVVLQQQIGEVRSRGFEVEAVATLSEGLKLVSAFTAYDLETTRSLDPTLIGRTPTNTPERFGSIFADYTIQGGEFRGLGGGAGLRYVGRSFADPLNQFVVPDRLVTDAVIHYERAGWRAAVNVTNLFDETFVSSCQSTTACFYGERRRVLGTLSYKW